MWNEHNYTLVWGIAVLWDWNENWPIPVLQPLLCFPNLLAYWCSTLAVASFRILNSSAGIPSPPLALLVMLPKAIWLHTPGCSRWVTTYHGFLGHEDLFCIVILCILATWGFPDDSDGKESACNAGHLGLIPGLGRSPGEGNGYPLQFSCLENPWTEEPGTLWSMGLQSQTGLSNKHFDFHVCIIYKQRQTLFLVIWLFIDI